MYLTLGAAMETPPGWEAISENDFVVADEAAGGTVAPATSISAPTVPGGMWETPISELVGGQGDGAAAVPTVYTASPAVVDVPEESAGFLGVDYKWWLIGLGLTAVLWYMGRDKPAAKAPVRARVQ